MPRFFLSEDAIGERNIEIGELISVEGGDARHISCSLRMEKGDSIVLCDSSSKEYVCTVESLDPSAVILKVDEIRRCDTEPPYRAVLYQALPKASKFDTIVQKAVETGVTRIVPVITERCISRPDEGSMKKKTERWQKIAEEAAKQCGRGIIPKVEGLMTYKEALKDAAEGELAFLCYEGEGAEPLGKILRKFPEATDIRFIIGAEGGFSLSEAEAAAKIGLKTANLGKRILRCETASAFTLACICCEKELL